MSRSLDYLEPGRQLVDADLRLGRGGIGPAERMIPLEEVVHRSDGRASHGGA